MKWKALSHVWLGDPMDCSARLLCPWNSPGQNTGVGCSVSQSCLTFCDLTDCSMLGFPVLHRLPELAQTWWCHPAILSSVVPFLIFSSIRSFSMSQLVTWGGQSIGASSFSVSPSHEYSGFCSFRIDWFDILAIQRMLKSLLQHHRCSKASVLQPQPS